MVDTFGTDINSNWTFNNNDINLVSNESNIGQAIVNRLNSDLDTYNTFYANYGGELYNLLGDLNNITTYEYIRIEIEFILQKDPRIKNVKCTINSLTNNTIEAKLEVITIGKEEVTPINLVLTDDLWVKINTEAGALENQDI